MKIHPCEECHSAITRAEILIYRFCDGTVKFMDRDSGERRKNLEYKWNWMKPVNWKLILNGSARELEGICKFDLQFVVFGIEARSLGF